MEYNTKINFSSTLTVRQLIGTRQQWFQYVLVTIAMFEVHEQQCMSHQFNPTQASWGTI